MKIFLNILYWFLIVLAVIQFIPVDRTNLPVDSRNNFVAIQQTPKPIHEILKNACYDCHSDETQYPDYAYFAPISWSIQDHIDEGREHLNFSRWGTYNPDLKKNMLENAAADLKQNRMPLAGYKIYHPKSNLNTAETILLAEYFENLLKSKTY